MRCSRRWSMTLQTDLVRHRGLIVPGLSPKESNADWVSSATASTCSSAVWSGLSLNKAIALCWFDSATAYAVRSGSPPPRRSVIRIMTCPAMLAIMAQAGPGSNYSFHVAKMRLESHAREGCSRRSRGTNTCAFPYTHAFTLRAARSMRLAQATRRSRLFGEPLIPYDGRMEEHIVSAARSIAGAHIPIRRPSCLASRSSG